MLSKKSLELQNDILKEQIREKDQKIHQLQMDIYKYSRPTLNNNDTDLNLKYLALLTKYNKLLDSCLSSETEHITYNGELYSIKSIDYHKDAETLDTINIEAIHVPREKGLVNNLAEPFKNVAKELSKIFFGNENM